MLNSNLPGVFSSVNAGINKSPKIEIQEAVKDAIKGQLANVASLSDLTLKADIAYVNTELAKKVNPSDLTSKADKTYVDSELTKKANSTDLTAKADKNYVDTQISSIASGGPKEVYATLAALQTAFPAGATGIYLVIADGKWYYWNGSWTAGGTYQSTGILDGSITKSKLDSDLGNYFLSFNQLANNIYMYQGINNAVTNVVNSNTIEVTTNTTFGQVGFTVPNVSGNKYKIFMTVTNIGTIDATSMRMRTGYSNTPGANSTVTVNGVTVDTFTTLAVGASRTWEVEVTTDQTNTAVIFGLSTNANGAVLRMTQRIYNITTLPDTIKNNVDWNNLPKYRLLSDFANKAFSADTATWADNGNFARPTDLEDKVVSTNIAEIRDNGNVFEYSLDGINWRQVKGGSNNNSYSSLEPNSGNYSVAQQVLNSNPTAGGFIGWVCITAGMANSFPWAAGSSYIIGDFVYSGENVYECIAEGVSGSTAPTGTGLGISDGVCSWNYVEKRAVFKQFGAISL